MSFDKCKHICDHLPQSRDRLFITSCPLPVNLHPTLIATVMLIFATID